jgi:hypothetical protein
VLQPLLLSPGRSSGEFWSGRWAHIVFLFEIGQNTKSDVHQPGFVTLKLESTVSKLNRSQTAAFPVESLLGRGKNTGTWGD